MSLFQGHAILDRPIRFQQRAGHRSQILLLPPKKRAKRRENEKVCKINVENFKFIWKGATHRNSSYMDGKPRPNAIKTDRVMLIQN